MKLVLSIAAGAFIAGMLIWWMQDPDGFRHRLFGYSQSEIDESWRKVHEQEAEVRRQLDARLLEAKTRTMELTQGEATALRYHMCHTYPPSTEQEKLQCKRLDELADGRAGDSKAKSKPKRIAQGCFEQAVPGGPLRPCNKK